MTERIQELRRLSLEAIESLSAERGLLITRFYRDHLNPEESTPVQRARAFAYLLANKHIHIGEGELIVGERGPVPKATPTYPEINLHSMKDLDILHEREKVSFRVDEDTRRAFKEEIIPFWEGRTNRERVFAAMEPEWLEAYQAGVFTEFQEQRAPGHTVLGDKIYRFGMLDLVGQIDERLEKLERTGEDQYKRRSDERLDGLAGNRGSQEVPGVGEQREELQAMRISALALVDYAERHADALDAMAAGVSDAERQAELRAMAAICRHVPARSPRTMHEALQYYWFVHLGVITELNPWDAFNPGRLDQHLLPFYQSDLAEKRLSNDNARELLQAFWIKFNNHPSPPKVGVTAQESNTYTDFCLINTGGLTPGGEDAVNELSFMILDVIEEMRLLQPSSMIQVSAKNPDAFIDRALEIVRTGFGQPSIFNTDAIVKELCGQGKSPEDARRGGASGCVESGAFGTEAYWLTGYFNLVKVLEVTLHNGTDPRSGKVIGVRSGAPEELKSFEDLLEAYRRQLQYFLEIKLRGNDSIERIFGEHMPVPFLSLLIDDCISNGRNYNAGGARYNTSYIQGVGLGSVTDILSALSSQVYGHERISLPTLIRVLEANFEGHEELRRALLEDSPKYGNDDDRADRWASWVFETFHSLVDGRPSPRGATCRINMLPTTSHVYFGNVCGATADGRQAGEPLSEGISPFQGMDRKGPTAVMNSALKICHTKTGGTLLNQKFTPSFLDDPQGIAKLRQLVRSYFARDGHHVQFNVVSAATLREAQEHPERHRDLIVRVAGYSDYFRDLGRDLQDEIIRRTEHGR